MAKTKKIIPKQTPAVGFVPPKTIEIKSDGNVLEYQNAINAHSSSETVVMYRYLYVKSETKLKQSLFLTENEINTLIKTQNSLGELK